MTPSPNDPLEAARRLGLDFGIAALARKMGRHVQVLSHQLNPEQEGHHLSLATAIAMTDLTNDERILQAWAAERGKLLVAVPVAAANEDELLDQVLELDELHGDFARNLHSARKDGVIDPSEFKLLSQLLHRVMVHAATLQGAVGSQVRSIPAITAGGKR